MKFSIRGQKLGQNLDANGIYLFERVESSGDVPLELPIYESLQNPVAEMLNTLYIVVNHEKFWRNDASTWTPNTTCFLHILGTHLRRAFPLQE